MDLKTLGTSLAFAAVTKSFGPYNPRLASFID